MTEETHKTQEDEEEDERAPGEALTDLIVRVWLLLPFAIILGEGYGVALIGLLGIIFFGLSFYRAKSVRIPGLMLVIIAAVFYLIGNLLVKIPTTIYALSQIISVQLLPLSAFPKLETAATWLLWIFIGLMFAGAGWKQMLLMLAIGGVAMGFLSSLGVFAVADSEIAASYNDLVQNTKMKNNTAGAVSSVWLMLSNPRLWYEQNYGFKNETLAQGMQTSPFALEITKAEVLEKVAPPDGQVTLDVQVRNKGLRDATLKRIDVAVEDANLGNYDRYLKSVATVDTNRDAGYLYFESTPNDEAHYYFCDNGYGKSTDSGGFKWSAGDKAVSTSATKTFSLGKFEPGVIDEYFATVNSPKCYGKQRLNVSAAYSYNVTATYNLEIINKDYFTELAKYNKLKFHTETSRSSEGPLKLTIRSVPEEQPVRADTAQGITVFYSLSNIGPGTAVIKNRNDISLENLDEGLIISPSECDFDVNDKKLNDLSKVSDAATKVKDATKNFYIMWGKKSGTVNNNLPDVAKQVPEGIDCGFDRKYTGTDSKEYVGKICLTFSPDDPNSIVLLKCKFTYDTAKSFDTTKTLFMKMHVNYDYITSRTAQYETTPMPGYHSCVTKRALDGFPNKTMMDLYLKEVFKDVTFADKVDNPFLKSWSSDGLTVGTDVTKTPACLCPTGCASGAKT